MAINPEENFKQLLRELFQLDKTDLDFGIYRILNIRSKDVEEFINKVLPEKLEEVKTKIAKRGLEDVKTEFDKVKKKLETDFEVDFSKPDDIKTKVVQFGQLEIFAEPYKKYIDNKKKLEKARLSEEFEIDIYNDLYRFFERYYDEGDFVTKPRAGENAYMIPYNGEEVKLYWANYDQYYIKTGENFKNYVFTSGDIKVEFKLIEAETTINNNQNQKGRVFIPTKEYFEWNLEENKLSIKFYYKIPTSEEKELWSDKQSIKKNNKGINEKLLIALETKIKETNNPVLILLWDKKTKKIGKDTVRDFHYHLIRYTSLNTSDYFIHKDLKKFLSNELDYFLKNEILSINFLSPDWSEEQVQNAIKQNIIKTGAIRDLALTIINFLSELENFQKMLFEKKKFVVQSDYCLTLDLIPKTVYNEIIDNILNDKEKKQLKNWLDLGFIENFEIDKKYIKKHDKLVLDTQYFTDELKYKLLNNIDKLDEKCNGLLINSENWQGINLLKTKYHKKVKCIYIDPPYNSKSSEIVYKNNFKHSSWISLMENRIKIGKELLNNIGVYIVAIDENEQERIGFILAQLFPEHEKTCISIVHNPGGIQGDNFAYTHEYAYFLYPKTGRYIGLENREKNADIRNFMNTAKGNTDNYLRSSGANCFYPIYIKDNRVISFGDVCDESFHPEPNILKDNKVIEVYPIDSNGIERKWVFARQSVEGIKDELNAQYNIQRKIWEIIRKKTMLNYKTVWIDKKYSAKMYGTQILKSIMGNENISFTFPKSLYTVIDSIRAGIYNSDKPIILDYFAGSGTTAHAVLKLNKEEGLNLKYILMEMGEYFNTVTKPRIQKVMYSQNWKNGKPQDMNGTSHLFQYIKLEQYEDSLNNIVFPEDIDEHTQTLRKKYKLSFEDTIKYILNKSTNNSASLLSVEKFINPFNYQMEIVELNERKYQNIDLVTTFNFLLGINIERIITETHQEQTYRIIKGIKNRQEYLIIWRNYNAQLDMAKERDWIQKQKWYNKDAFIYCNADNAFGAKSIEEDFKRLMFENVNIN